MLPAGATAFLAVPERPLAERPEAREPEASDGQFAGLMAQFVQAPSQNPSPMSGQASGQAERAETPVNEGGQARPEPAGSEAPRREAAARAQAPQTQDTKPEAPATPPTKATAASEKAEGTQDMAAPAAGTPAATAPVALPPAALAPATVTPQPAPSGAATEAAKGPGTPAQVLAASIPAVLPRDPVLSVPTPSKGEAAPEVPAPASTSAPQTPQATVPVASPAPAHTPNPLDPATPAAQAALPIADIQGPPAQDPGAKGAGTPAVLAVTPPPTPQAPVQSTMPDLKEANPTSKKTATPQPAAPPKAAVETAVPLVAPGPSAPPAPGLRTADLRQDRIKASDATSPAVSEAPTDPAVAAASPAAQPAEPPPLKPEAGFLLPETAMPRVATHAETSALTAAGTPIAPSGRASVPAPVAPAAPPSAPPPAPAGPIAQIDGSLRWMLKGGAQEARLQLHPESLGQVTIHLRVEGGEVHARLWVTEPASVQAVQEGRPHLEQSLREQGLQLGSFDLQQGHRPFQEAPPPPTFRDRSPLAGLAARQEAPAALAPSILNPHHVELYA